MKLGRWFKVFWVVAAVTTGILFSLRPWQVAHEQKKVTDQLTAEMHASEKRHAEDRQKEARYDTSTGREELARSMGYHKRDEKPVAP